jgi:CheY-like chemotaxis protein
MTPGRPDPGLAPLLLLIDDHDDTRVPAGELLAACGFRVELATGGDEGLAKAVALTPDVIVTDLVMPEVSGFEVCERLKRDPATRGIPLVVYTAMTDRAALARLHSAGVALFAIKPCLPTVIGHEVHALIAAAPGRDQTGKPRVVTGYGETLDALFGDDETAPAG